MTYRFADIIDVSIVQQLVDQQWQISGVPMGILDVDGTILVAVGWQRICLDFHRQHPQTVRLCHESDDYMAQHLNSGEPLPECGYIEYRCKNGMIDIGMPFIVHGHHLANVFLGQFFYEAPDEEFFRDQARRYGFDEQHYLEALHAVPILSREKVQHILAYNQSLIHLLTNMAETQLNQLAFQQSLQHKQQRLRRQNEAVMQLDLRRSIYQGSFEETVRAVVETTAQVLEVSRVSVWLLDHNRTKLRCIDCWTTSQEHLASDPSIDIHDYPTYWSSFHQQHFLAADDVTADPRTRELRDDYLNPLKIKSMMDTAIRENGEVVGMLCCEQCETPRSWQLDEQHFCSSMADYISLALDAANRHQVQQALRQSEKRFQTFFQASSVGMAIVRPDGVIQESNPAILHYLGYTKKQLVGKNILDLTHPEDRTSSRQLMQQLVDGQKKHVAVEKRYLRRDGTIVWGYISVALVCDENNQPQYFISQIQDITQHKKSEVDLRESERRLATLMANLPGMVYRCHNDRYWTMDFISEGCHALVGYAPEDLVDNRTVALNDLIVEEDRDHVWHQVQQAVAIQKPYQIEYRLRSRRGEVRWVWEHGQGVFDANGSLIALEGFIGNISKRKKAEQQLKQALEEAEQAREKINAILTSVADGLVVTDQQQRVVLVNPFARQLSDHPKARTHLQPLDQLYSEPAFLQQVASVIGKQKSDAVTEWKSTQLNRVPFSVIEARTSPVHNQMGKQTGTISILRDVSPQHELDQLKTEFISTAAHELRTPLTAVMGFSELLLNETEFGVDDPGQRHQMLATIYEKAQRLETIVSDLLDLSRVQSGQLITLTKEPVMIGQLIEKVVKEEQQNSDRHQYSVDLTQSQTTLNLDAKKIEQVLENLLNNARKFSPPDSEIEISGHPVTAGYQVTIKDHGRGMTKEQVEKVFDKFYRADASDTAHAGLGLGMTIVKNIIQSHGGTIDVHSVPGKGTQICFTLPTKTAH